jgi:hypothetical protein
MRLNARTTKILLAGAAAAAVPAGLLGAGTASAAPAHGGGSGFTVRQLASGQKLTHKFTPSGSSQAKTEKLTLPDDITSLGRNVFVTFQNGVGPQGQASTSGNLGTTIVEFTPSGRVVHQWDLRGKCDGLTADPRTGTVVATVNEDLNSSLYTIGPRKWRGGQVQHYTYSKNPLPHNGGTDAITVYHGQLFISASAPGTTGAAAPNAAYPAVYIVSLKTKTHVATVRPLFSDEAQATVANAGAGSGKTVKLGLTDPDSSTVVPFSSARFRGDYVLDSQGDQQQIYVAHAGTKHQSLSVLNLSQAVDDTVWATSRDGRLYVTDSGADTVNVVAGPFRSGTAFSSVTPCDASSAPAICPAPPKFPANYLGTLNLNTGNLSPVNLHGRTLHSQSLEFVG